MLGLFSSPAVALAAVFSNGSSIGSTQVAYGDSGGKIASDSGFFRSSLVLTLDANTDNTLTTGYGKLGLATSGTTTAFYLAQASNYNSTDFMIRQGAGGGTVLNSKGGTTTILTIGNATKATLATGSLTLASGVPLVASDTTDGTSGSAGAFNTLGGIGVTKAGWFGGIVTANGATAAGTQPTFVGTGTSTIVGGVTDGYTTSHRFTPTYSAGSALTVTRHNYIDLNNPTLSGAGPAAMTDACVFRFDAAIGTHKAVDSGTTKTSPGTVTAWTKININGTVHYQPAYASKTT